MHTNCPGFTDSKHVAPFKHGSDSHSFISSLQSGPVHPAVHVHLEGQKPENERWQGRIKINSLFQSLPTLSIKKKN